MNHLDDLRDALQSPPGFAAGELDLGAIMAAGGRRRRAHRLAVSAASGLAVAVLLAGGGLLAARDVRGAPVPIPPAAEATHGSPSASPLPTDAGVRPPLGGVISTGLTAKHGTWVLYAVAVDEKALPQTRFGIMAGRRMADGSFTSDVITNETSGAGTAPGFHAAQGPMNVDGEDVPAFGYYVGPAARITVAAGKKTVEAGLATWSEDPSVVIFWFDPAKIRGAKLTKLAAFDRNGRRLYGKNAGFGVG
jgi:hypothetical protein